MRAIQMQLSPKPKIFLYLFQKFWNINEIHNIIQKKMTLIAKVFPKLRTSKNVVR